MKLADLFTPEPEYLAMDYSRDRIIPFPEQVWQLIGHVPDLAVLAYGEEDARVKVEELLKRPLTRADRIERIR